MSLINDALKRANQTRKQQSTGTSAGPVMQPMATPGRSPSLAPILFIGILVMFLAGFGTLFLVRWIYSGQPTVVSLHPAEQTAGPVVPVAPVVSAPPAPVLTPQLQPAQQPVVVVARPSKPIVNTSVVVTIPMPGAVVQGAVAAKTAAEPVVARPETTVAAVADKVPLEEVPNLKLQGIYFRRSNPSAMINGRSVYLGEELEGARIISIERTSVVIEIKGQKQVLHLP